MNRVENGMYPFFWQHGETHEVLNNYMEKICESGMKGICVEARPHPEFVEEGWWKDMDCILAKAKKLNMNVWILDDSHFPTGYANGKIKKDYPQYKKIYLDMRRYDVQGPMKGARIDFQMLKERPWEKPDLSQKIVGVYLAKRISQRDMTDSIAIETLKDISECMKNRLLTFDIPSGAYSIFVVYTTKKGGEEATGDYLNPLMKEATQVLIDEVYEPHFEHYGMYFGNLIQGFFSDEPRFGNIKGTDGRIGRTDMVLPWREGLEKELDFEKKFLPLLWVKADGKESDIRFRYMDLVTTLYEQNFTQVLANWCEKHGVWYLGHTIEDNGAHARLGYGTGHFFRGQSGMHFSGIDVIGTQIVPGMNYHHDGFSTGGCNGEFYHYALAKLGTSAAHLDKKKEGRTMCEAFGAYGWNEGLKMMKWITDHLIVRGVNYLVPHAFDPKEFPDWDCPPHFYAHGHNPQFRYFKNFSDYANRLMSLMRGGVHPAKVGVFYPAELEWAGEAMPVEKPARELTTHQISFDIVTRDYLKQAVIGEGHYRITDQSFEVLVIPYGEAFPADIAEKLICMAKAGVQILYVHKKPDKLVGRCSSDRLFKEFCSHVLCVKLSALGVALEKYRAVSFENEEEDLVVGEYEKEGQKIYMFFNEHIEKRIQKNLSLKEQGFVYEYNAWTDEWYQLEKQNGGFELSMTPYESKLWVVSEQELDCAESKKNKHSMKRLELPQTWEVRFADSFSYPQFIEAVPCKELCCIHQLEGWDQKVGTVSFEGTVEVENECMAAMLDLGDVYETAEMFVDDISKGVKICKPYHFELGALTMGKHKLRIEVTNTLGTAQRDGLNHYLVIEPFGIEGPVKLDVI